MCRDKARISNLFIKTAGFLSALNLSSTKSEVKLIVGFKKFGTCVFVEIFRNFNEISDFSFAMNSYGYEDNFQRKEFKNPLKIGR